MQLVNLNNSYFLKQNDTATQIKLGVLDYEGNPFPLDTAEKIEVVIGVEEGRVLVKEASLLSGIGEIEFGLDEGDLLPVGDNRLEVHIYTSNGEKHVVPSKGYYKLRVQKAIDDLDVQVTTYTLDYFLDQVNKITEGLPETVKEAQRLAEQMQMDLDEVAQLKVDAQEAARLSNESRNVANQIIDDMSTVKTDAENATANANLAATNATNAADNANVAADNANNAADNANTQAANAQNAAQAANQAANNANVAADNANLAAERANNEADYAKAQGDYAKAQGNYAKTQGDYAKEQGDAANLATNNANDAANNANNAATNADNAADNANTAADNANTKATYAQQQGDYAKSQAELINDILDQGSVVAVNGKTGNVTLTAEDVNAIPISEKGAVGGVARLNEEGKVVDANGMEVEGKVKTVNGISPDENGNIEIETTTSWNDLSDIPTSFPPSAHTHQISEVDGLQDALNEKASSEDLISLEQTLNEHSAKKIHQGEVHGLRLTDGKLEYFDGQEWQRVKGGSGGYPVGNVTNFRAKEGNGEVILTWEDPADVTTTDNNNNIITIARWKGTKILRKTGSYPQNENDGVLVVDNGIRNQYAENGFIDTGLTNGVTYYYMAFPYTQEDVYTVDVVNRVEATPTEQRIYGVRIDKNNSNPETRVTYIGDAVGFTPMRGNDGNFQWGSWKEVFESFEIRPCVLKNKQVQYYLDPNDFTKKIDGSPANLTGADGDVMIEFGKTLWWKWTDEGTTYTIEISDKAFDGAVKHAFEIEEGYNLVPYYPLLLTQVLFVIFFKSTDSQTALGRGYVDGNTSYASTGNTNNKGMFYGSENSSEQMKFLGIEDYWGNKYWWIDGLVTDSNYNLLIGKGSFNNNGSGYDVHDSGVSSNTSGYIDTVQGGNNKGFIIKSGNGSATTYYADHGYLISSQVVRFGGYRSSGSYAGFAHLRLYHADSDSLAIVSARLFCSVGDKIYIGAYLGTTQNGKLRSVSGTSEPTGNKTIGAFRNEARANN